MAQPGFKKELSEKLLQIYLTLTYTAGAETFFTGLKKLLPGRCMTWQNGKLTVHRYWRPEFHADDSKTVEEWAEELHTTLQQIMQEVKEPGEYAETFLSAGVESSYLLALSASPMGNSFGYDSSRLHESVLAAQTAAVLGRGNRRCCVTPEGYFDAVPYVLERM